MDNPERHLRDFIRQHFYGEVSDDLVDSDVDDLVTYMRECGWQFTATPAARLLSIRQS